MTDTDEARQVKEKYLKFDWKNSKWQSYYNGIYPPPRTATILTKYKKKWFKSTVDENLDLSWDPDTQPVTKPKPTVPGYAGFYRPIAGSGYDRPGISISTTDAAFLCVGSVTLAITGLLSTFFVPSLLNAFYLGEAMLCIMDISTHFGFKRTKGHLATIMADEAGHLLVMLLAYYFASNVRMLNTLMFFPIGVTNLMLAGSLCKKYTLPLPDVITQRLRMFGHDSYKFPMIQGRANVEIATCFVVVILFIGKFFSQYIRETSHDISFLVATFNINLIHARYATDPFTQAGVRGIDTAFLSVIGGTPVEKLYTKVRDAVVTVMQGLGSAIPVDDHM